MLKQLHLAYFKINTLTTIVMLLSLDLFSQNKIYKEEYNLNTFIRPETISYSKTIIAYSDNCIYSLKQNSSSDTKELLIYKFVKDKKKLTIIRVKKNKNNSSLFGSPILSIASLDRKFIILTSYNIFILNKKDDELIVESTIKNEKGFTKLLNLTKNELLLYVNYNYHPAEGLDKHAWAKLNLESKTITDYTLKGHENVIFSYFVNNWISTYKGFIAYAQTTNYDIKFFNSDFEPVDSLKSDLLNSNLKHLHLVPKGQKYSMDEMNKIAKADDTLLTRIEKIFLLDSSKILVTIKLPRLKYLRYDIWSKKNKVWEIIKTDTLPAYYQKGQAYNSKNNSVSGFFGNMDGLCYTDNLEFYFFYFPFIENIVTESYDSKKDYDEKVNEMTRKKELYYGIKKLKISHD